jgi:hypothetical protein
MKKPVETFAVPVAAPRGARMLAAATAAAVASAEGTLTVPDRPREPKPLSLERIKGRTGPGEEPSETEVSGEARRSLRVRRRRGAWGSTEVEVEHIVGHHLLILIRLTRTRRRRRVFLFLVVFVDRKLGAGGVELSRVREEGGGGETRRSESVGTRGAQGVHVDA